MLTSLMVVLCVVYTWDYNPKDLKGFFILIFVTSFSLINFFLASDIFLFYLAFESVLIPLFLMIGLYGSRERRIHAAYQFFFYTLIGSFFMLIAIMYIFNRTGTTLFIFLNKFPFTFTEQIYLWAAFAFALAVKIPLPPLHIWLPEAHVEAPTVGSVLLAAVVLKMGGFGIIRILIPILPQATLYCQSIVFTICILGMTYAAFTAVRQLDIKKIIAYSSVVHMAYCTLGLFSFSNLTISSSVLGMFAHGLISGGLFFCVGCLYDRYQTRDLHSYGALIHFSPILAGTFFVLFISNMAFPGTANFPAEVGIFIGLFLESTTLTILLFLGLVLNGVYNIWLSTRLIFGPYSSKSMVYNKAFDLTFKEKLILYTLWLWIILLGLFPGNFLSHLDFYVRALIDDIK
jgi:proton-translocating NADH-quinone oxidoreductase chain M